MASSPDSKDTSAPNPALDFSSVEAQLDRMPVGSLHRWLVFVIGLGLFFDMYEIFLSSSIGTALSADFSETGTELKLLLASAFLGMFVGAACLGGLADRIGRRKAFIVNLLWYSAWSLIGAFSPSAGFLVFARFMAGIGVGAEYPVADAYLSDVLPKDKRGRMATWAYTCSFIAVPVVGFLALLLNKYPLFNVPGWRWLLGLGGIGALVVVFVRRNLPESPRWLAGQGRLSEARDVLARFAKGSGVQVLTPSGPTPASSSGSSRTEPALTDGNVASVDAQSSWKRLLRPPYRKRLLMFGIFHLLQTFGYYGFGTLAVITLVARGFDVTQSLLYISLSYLGYPIGSLLSTPLVKRFERKFLLIAAIVLLAVTGFIFATATSPVVIVIFGFLTTVTSNIFSNVFHVYQAEIFPTAVRARAVGWTYSLSRLSSGLLPFILLPILEHWGSGAMFTVVAVALAIIAVAVAVGGPRTYRRSVEEINPS